MNMKEIKLLAAKYDPFIARVTRDFNIDVGEICSSFDRFYGKDRELIIKACERLKKLMNIELPEINVDIKTSDIVEEWIEWRTSGIVYGKVLGHKKSFEFSVSQITEAPAAIVKHADGEVSVIEIPRVSFEVAVDIMSFLVKNDRERRIVRRIFDWRGKIEAWYIARMNDGKLYKQKIGELTIDWLGHSKLDENAEKRIYKIKKQINLLKERLAEVDKRIARRIAKIIIELEEEMRKLEKLTRRYYAARLRVFGNIAQIKVQKEILAVKRADRRKLAWGGQELYIVPREDVERVPAHHEVIVEKKFTFFGRYGKLNHELWIAAIPKHKIEVDAFVETKPQWFRRILKTTRHKVIVKEVYGNHKMWIIVPYDNVARFILYNKDHGREGLDRILVHLERNEALVFIHRL